MTRTWSKFDEKSLAKFVIPEARRWVRLGVNRADLLAQPNGRRRIVEAIYAGLRQHSIRYAPEQYQPELAQQVVRSPVDILDTPGEGTCLDLATLFAGMCLGYELIPVVVVTEVHALCLVSLTHGAPEWDALTRGDRETFEDLVTDSQELIALVDSGAFIAVECTGFAHSETLPPESVEGSGREDGYLPFLGATQAGRAQLERSDSPMRFAFDATVAQYHWKIEPPRIDTDAEIATAELVASQVAAGFRLEKTKGEGSLIPYPRPVEPMLRQAVGFVDRRSEVATAIQGAIGGISWVTGEEGAGKTSILRRLGHEDRPHGYPDGVIHLSEVHNATDGAQQVLDSFFATNDSFKPSRTRIGQAIRDLRALVLVDNADAQIVQGIADLMPSSGFVATSEAPGPGAVVPVAGLGEEDAVEVFAANLGRDLGLEERPRVEELCGLLGGHPARIIDAARAVVGGTSTLDALTARSVEEVSGASRTRYEALEENSRLVVDLTTVFEDTGVLGVHLEQMVPGDTAKTLSGLVSERVVETSSPRYRIAGTWMGRVADEVRLEMARSLALDYFEEYAGRATTEEAASSLPELLVVMRWAMEAGRWGLVTTLGTLAEGVAALTRNWGLWETILDSVRSAAINSGNEAAHAYALHQLGTRARLVGDRKTAKRLLKRARKMRRGLGDTEAAGLSAHNLGFARLGWVPWVVGTAIAVGVGTGVVCGTTDVCSPPEPGEVVVSVRPGEIGFPDQPVGGGSESEVVEIVNNGGTPATLSSARIDGERSFEIVGTDCPDVLEGGGVCEYRVVFAPARSGEHEATLIVDVRDAGSLTSRLFGIALEPAEVTIDPVFGEFGEVPVGETAEVSFTLSNRGDQEAFVGDPSLEGEHFSVDFEDCGGPVEAGGSCLVIVHLTPDREPERGLEDRIEEGLLTIETDPSGPIAVSLQGTSVFVLPDLTIEISDATPIGRELIGGTDMVVIRVDTTVRNSGRAGAAGIRTTAEIQVDGQWFQAPFTDDLRIAGFDSVIDQEILPGEELSFTGFILRSRSRIEDTSAPLPVRLIVDSCAGQEFAEEHCDVLESNEDNNLSNEVNVNPLVGETELRLERTDGELPYATYRETNTANLVADALQWLGQVTAETEGLDHPLVFMDASTVIPPTDDGRFDIPRGELYLLDLVDIAPSGRPALLEGVSTAEIQQIFEVAASQWRFEPFPHVPRGSFLAWCSSGPSWVFELILDGHLIVESTELVDESVVVAMTTESMVDGSNGFFLPATVQDRSMVEVLSLYITEALGGLISADEYPFFEGRLDDVCGID